MVIGHQKQIKFLQKMAESGEIPHALLFSGQEKLGKKTIAFEFISSIFGEPPASFAGGRHPDFILVTPVVKESGEGEIQIDQIRELSWRLSLKPIKAKILATVIDKAHLMTKEAQNCFLKTLEEPKANSVLILITEHPYLLLPTILSRCETIKFYPVKNEEIKNFLKERGLSLKDIEEISEISLGRPGVAEEFLEDPEKLKAKKQRIKDLIKISRSPLFNRFQYAKDISNTPDLKDILNDWLFYFRNILISKSGNFALEKVKNILNTLQRIIFLISTTNVNTRLALEMVLMEL